MKTAVKALFAVGFAVITTVAAAVGIRGAPGMPTDAATLVPKDQARILPDADSAAAEGYGAALAQLGQPMRPQPQIGPRPNFPPMPPGEGGPHGPGFGFGPGAGGFGRPGPAPMHFAGPGRPPGPFAGPPLGAMAANRFACEEDIDRHAALAGYLRSKLKLEGPQKDAWQKVELAAEPVVEKMQTACASLPAEPGMPPNFPTMIDLADKQLSLRAELVHAIAAPVRALYDTLSPEQRGVLDRPLPPPPPPP